MIENNPTINIHNQSHIALRKRERIMRIIDSHAHLTFDIFKNDLEQVIDRALRTNIVAIINPTIDPEDFIKAMRISQKYPKYIIPALGLAPQTSNQRNLNAFFDAIKVHRGQYIAIGECGLDYYWVTDPKQVNFMKNSFEKIVKIASDYNLPLIIHARTAHQKNAYLEVVSILKENNIENAVFHAFFGKKSDAMEIIKHNWFIGIPTIYVRRVDLWRVLEKIPVENMLVETDSPYLSPVRGLRNEPANVRKVLEVISQIKNINIYEAADIIFNSTKTFFKLRI